MQFDHGSPEAFDFTSILVALAVVSYHRKYICRSIRLGWSPTSDKLFKSAWINILSIFTFVLNVELRARMIFLRVCTHVLSFLNTFTE